MKRFDSKPWMLPQPVLIMGTYDTTGQPNAMNAAWAGTWDMDEIMVSLGTHATTDDLKGNGEFTVAFATADRMTASDLVGIVSGACGKELKQVRLSRAARHAEIAANRISKKLKKLKKLSS